MDLQCDGALAGEIVHLPDVVGAKCAIEPGLHLIAADADEACVPPRWIESFLSNLGELTQGFLAGFFFAGSAIAVRVVPAAEVFCIEQTGPPALGGIHLELDAGEFFGVVVFRMIHQAGVALEVIEAELEVEQVAVVFLGGVEEGVAFQVLTRAGNDTVFEGKLDLRFVVMDFPAIEVVADEGAKAVFFEFCEVDIVEQKLSVDGCCRSIIATSLEGLESVAIMSM